MDIVPNTNTRTSDILRNFFTNNAEVVLEETNTVDQAELEFLRQFQDELSKTDIPFLESVPANAYLAERANALKNKVTVPLKGKNVVATICGPRIVCYLNVQEQKRCQMIILHLFLLLC